jgi:O-antigen/teichoic acid export membrane protein
VSGEGSATARIYWKGDPLGWLKSERVLSHNLIVGAGTMIAGLLGVAFQSLASHQMRPAEYGGVFAVVTLLSSIGLPATAFTLLMARETSRARATGLHAPSASLLRHGNNALLLVGCGLAAVIAAGSPLLSTYLGIPVSLLLAGAIGLPFALALPLLLGELQGQERFTALAALMTGQAALKLIAAVVLGIALGPWGIVAGITVATVAAYVTNVWLVRRQLRRRSAAAWLRPAAGYLVIVLPSTLALGVLLSADVLLVKHFFASKEAGEYAAIAAIGRAIFWGASGVATVLFPKVVYRGVKGSSGAMLVAASLVLVAAGGLAGLAVLAIVSTSILEVFSGSAYVAAAPLLPLYAVGMMLLGVVAILNAAHQSMGKGGFLWILIPSALLEPLLVAAFHTTLTQTVLMVDVGMGVCAAGLAIGYALRLRSSGPAGVSLHESPPTLQTVPELQLN